MDLPDELSRVLKYNAEAERQSFEKAIDANPLDATTHLVYADWLQERGEDHEAAFRRAMGEWFGTKPDYAHFPLGNLYRSSRKHLHPHSVAADSLPPFASGIPSYHHNYDDHPEDTSIAATHSENDTRRRWQTYRDMETAFRNAFMAGRNRTS